MNTMMAYETLPDYIVGDRPRPAEFLVRKLFSDFTSLASKKIETILIHDPIEKSLAESIQREDDSTFDRMLTALGTVSEFCLPSLLRALFAWHHHQLNLEAFIYKASGQAAASTTDNSHQDEVTNNCEVGLDSGAIDVVTKEEQPNSSSTQSDRTFDHTNSMVKLCAFNTEVNDGPSPSSVSAAITISVKPDGINTNAAISTSGQTPDLQSCSLEHSTLRASSTVDASSRTISPTFELSDMPCLADAQFLKKRELAIEYIFCLTLIEILGQLMMHPGHEDLINHIENLAFKHFGFREEELNEPNIQNIHIISELYSKVIGVLAQTRFRSVRRRFMAELKELRSKDQTLAVIQSVISLLVGMRFVRVKMVPIEDFEACFLFLQECASYFLEVRSKEIKHALAGLFVEILLPVAATVKNEVNVPCLKNFVDILYPQTLDMCTKKKHALALFPLVTCLLCVSQRTFFLGNWNIFLSMCLSNLKNRDPKMCRVALESLYRLLWVYMIRIKCESNTVTQTRLNSIVYSLFPKGSKTIVPRDAPLTVLVKIIQFIAQERLDFAMKQVLFNLLSVDRPIKVIMSPERMNIGLRAFLLIADSLEQKESEPPMPSSVCLSPSDSAFYIRKSHLKTLTEDVARNLGLSQYYPFIRHSFNEILRALDAQVGRPLLSTNTQNLTKEPSDVITGERKSKIDLFKTCVAIIPRLMPNVMSHTELIELLVRATVHMDEELRRLALESLHDLIANYIDWRLDIIERFIHFIIAEINDISDHEVDESLRQMHQLLIDWKNTVTGVEISTTINNALNTDGNATTTQSGTTISYSSPISQLSLIRQTKQLLTEPASLRKDKDQDKEATGSIDRKQETIKRRKRREVLRNQVKKVHDLLVSIHSIGGLFSPNSPVIQTLSHNENEEFSPGDSLLGRVEHIRGLLDLEDKEKIESDLNTRCDEDDEVERRQERKGCHDGRNLNQQDDPTGEPQLPVLQAEYGDLYAFAQDLIGDFSKESHSTLLKLLFETYDMVVAEADSCSDTDQLSGCSPPDVDLGVPNESSSNILIKSAFDIPLITVDHSEEFFCDLSLPNETAVTVRNSYFWVAVLMLRSDYDHELHFALRMLHKYIKLSHLETTKQMHHLEKKMDPINWVGFPGVHSLVLKGCLKNETYETAITVLDQLIPLLDQTIIDQNDPPYSFTHSVMAFLTYLMLNYDEPNQLCIQIARHTASWCNDNSTKLDNLATVMTLYSRRTFSKDRLQWVKCVVKYLYDSYSQLFDNLITFLVTMLDKGPPQLSAHILSILLCVFHYVDLGSLGSQVNSDLLKIINKYSDNLCWKEALKVFKLIVSRSSILPTPTSATSTMLSSSSFHPVHQFGYHHPYQSLPFNSFTPINASFGSPTPSLVNNTDSISFSSLPLPSNATADTVINGSLDFTSSSTASIVTAVSASSTACSTVRRELPGRTMEFQIDIESIPLIAADLIVIEPPVPTEDILLSVYIFQQLPFRYRD